MLIDSQATAIESVAAAVKVKRGWIIGLSAKCRRSTFVHCSKPKNVKEKNKIATISGDDDGGLERAPTLTFLIGSTRVVE